jgi:hypothetical protein
LRLPEDLIERQGVSALGLRAASSNASLKPGADSSARVSMRLSYSSFDISTASPRR